MLYRAGVGQTVKDYYNTFVSEADIELENQLFAEHGFVMNQYTSLQNSPYAIELKNNMCVHRCMVEFSNIIIGY